VSVRDRFARLLGLKAAQSFPVPLPVLTFDYEQLRMEAPSGVQRSGSAGRALLWGAAFQAPAGGFALASVLAQLPRESPGIIVANAAAVDPTFFFAPGLYELSLTGYSALGGLKGYSLTPVPRRTSATGTFIGTSGFTGPQLNFLGIGGNLSPFNLKTRFFFPEEWFIQILVAGAAWAVGDTAVLNLAITGLSTTDDVSEALQGAVTP